MPDVNTSAFRTQMNNAFFKGGPAPAQLFVRLFTDTANITDSTSLASIAAHEQTGGGYAPKAVVPADWTVERVANGVRARLADQTWTTTATGWGGLRWVVLTTTADNTGVILSAKDHGTGITVTGVGANVTVDDFAFTLLD